MSILESVGSGSLDPTAFLDPNNPDYLQYIVELFNFLQLPEPWENRRDAIWGTVIPAMSLSAICVLFRLFVRLRVVRSPGWDDMFVALYLFTTAVTAVCVCLAPNNGLGRHILVIPLDDLRRFLILWYIINASYVTSTAFIKLSLLFQYLRLYKKRSRLWWLCVILTVIVALWGTAFSVMAWVPCFPIHVFWDFMGSSRNCYGFGVPVDRTAYIAHTSSNMGFDVLVFAMPIPLYLRHDTAFKTRVGMVGLLLLGCLVNLFAAWRLGVVIKSESVPATALDPTWFAPSLILLAVLEVSIASICASTPIFWPILQKKFYTIFVTHEVEVVHEERIKESEDTEEPKRRPGTSSSRETHYNDTFIMEQVVPFSLAGTETTVQSERPGTGKKRRGLF